MLFLCDSEEVAQELIEKVEIRLCEILLELVDEEEGNLVQGGDSFDPQVFGLGIINREQNVDYAVRVVNVPEVYCMFSDKQHNDRL